MKVRKSVIQKLDTKTGLGLVMFTLDVSPNTARKLIKSNEPDSDLTKSSMVKAIAQEYELPDDRILFDENNPEDLLEEESHEVRESQS